LVFDHADHREELYSFSLDSPEGLFLHSAYARKEVVQWTVAINPARWLTLRFVLA
jgi:hypothetical protein